MNPDFIKNFSAPNSQEKLSGVYNQALEMLKKGHSKEEVLVKFSSFREELAPLLEMSVNLLTIPKNIVPTPLMQRRYAMAPVKHAWLAWLKVSKFAGVSMSVMLLVSAASVMAYQASLSGPGQILFPVKKQAEQIKLILASGQDAKANVQIEITQQRLDEAQAIFSNPGSNIEQKKAALSELSDQTTTAIAQVNTVAKNDPNSGNNHPLLSVLDSITQKQQNLLSKIQPDSQINTDTHTALQALNANTAKLSQIKESIIAATNSQVLTSLSSEPNAVVVYGQITQVSKDQITVEKLTFVFGGQTIIKDTAGNNLSMESLNTDLKANVIGVKSQNILIAQQVLISPKDPSQPDVKGTATGTPGITPTVSAPAIKKPETQNTPKEIPQDTGADQQILQNSNTASGTASGLFIYEDPRPQFVK